MDSLDVQSQKFAPPVMERLRGFFIQHCEPPRSGVPAELQQQQQGTPPSQSLVARSLWTQEVDCMRLLACCPELGQPLFTDTLALLDTLRAESAALCREAAQAIRPDELSIRLTHLPTVSSVLPTLPPRGGQLVQVCGSIVRMSTKRVVPYAYRLMCPRCRNVVEAFTHPFDRAAASKRSCERAECKKEELQVVGQVWMDYAEGRLQQRSNQSGKLPRSLLITLDDDLSARCGVGQFVEVIGILHLTWRHLYPLSRPAIEPAIWVINVLPMEAYRGAAIAAGVGSAAAAAVNQQRRRNGQQGERPKFSPEAFFTSFMKNKRRRGVALVNSTAPQLYGLFAPRMSILLSALNGTSMAGKTSMHIRSTIHCLFVGDPSTGKSQLLRFAAGIAPRSTSTTGMGSTSAGLTVAATKEQNEWVLEPGALVLSDGGVCVIDELRTVSPADRASLHEAMEQQTISVAKGGLVTKLRTACSVLSACNPPPLKRNGRPEIGVGGPLLSRFDFIYLLWDTPQGEIDTRVADHVLSCNVANHHPDPPLMAEELARYLWWLRAQYAQVDGPLLSDGAADLLGRYYEIQRQRGASPSLDDAVPVTVRLLESMVRITQAHAKLHLQSVCSVDDAAMAIFLMERSAHGLKVPLRVLGPDLYSSSRELDEVFLSDAPQALEMQGAVLDALVGVIQRYTLPPPGADSTARHPQLPGGPLGGTEQPQPRVSDFHSSGADSGGFGDALPAPQAPPITAAATSTAAQRSVPSGGGAPGGFVASQYERCQLLVPAPAAAGGTQLTADELAGGAYDLLAFRWHQQQRQEGSVVPVAGGQGGSSAGPAPSPSPPPASQLGTAAPAGGGGAQAQEAQQRRSQLALVEESAAQLAREVNLSFTTPASRAVYAATGGGRASSAYSSNAADSPNREAAMVLSAVTSADGRTTTAARFSASPSMGCPPAVEQTAPPKATQPDYCGSQLFIDPELECAPPQQPQPQHDSGVTHSSVPTPALTQAPGTQTGKRRKRSAEDIMRSLRFRF